MTTVAFDAATDAGGFTSSSSRSWTHTVGSGSNRILYVWACFWNSGGSVSGVTYGGVSLTRVLQSALSSSQDRVECWRLLNPTAGSATVAVTFSATADGETASLSFNTVNQTTPERNTGSSTGTITGAGSASISATGALTGDAIIDGIGWADRSKAGTMTAHTNRVQRFNTSVTAGEGGAGSSVTTAPDPATMDWTFTGGGNADRAMGFVVIANDGGGATTAYRDATARIRAAATAFRDAVARIRTAARAFRDSTVRIRAAATAWRDSTARVRVATTAFRDATARVRTAVTSYRHATARVAVRVQAYRDSAFRIVVQVVGGAYRDTSVRIRAAARAFRDSTVRIRTAVQGYVNAAVRVVTSVQAYRDSAFRVRTGVRAFRDAAVRLRAAATRTVDATIRIRSTGLGYRDARVRIVVTGTGILFKPLFYARTRSLQFTEAARAISFTAEAPPT